MDKPRSDIRIGYFCNNNCRFCCVGEQEKFELTTDEIIEELNFSKKNGIEKIVFTGGEPTIRKDIIQLVSYASNLGFKEVVVITNGRMTSYPDFFNKLVDAGLTGICFSLLDIREDVYEHLCQVKGSFKQLMRSLDLAKKSDLLVSTITIMTKLNYENLPNIAKFLNDFKNEHPHFFCEFMFINPTESAWKHREELVPKISEVTPYIHKSLEFAKKNNLHLNVEAIPFCYMIGFEDNIVELTMAKKRIIMDPGKEAKLDPESDRRIFGKTKSVYCKECKFNSVCEGVWTNYAKIHGLEELRYPSPGKTLIGLGTDCNQKCIFCTLEKSMKKENPEFKGKVYVESESENVTPTTSQVKSEIDKSNSLEIMFGWPEPTLRRDLPELIKYARRKNVTKVSINTNGVKISDENYISKLIDSGLNKIIISIHSHKKEISEKISQIEGNYDKTMIGIKNSLEKGLEVNLVHVICSHNYKDLLDFSKFIKEKFNGVSHIDFVFIKPDNSDIELSKELVPKIEDVKPYLMNALKFCKESMIDFSTANIPLCLLDEFKESSIQYQELNAIDSEHAFRDWMKLRLKNNETDEYGYKSIRCKNCAFNQKCVGLIKEYFEIYGTKELKPISKD